MHLRSVEIFCDVVQQRSFSKAAEAHHVSQSSASQAVHMLEERLGTLLIDRSKRPFELTPAGQVYFEGCREMLESFHAVEDRVHQIQGKVTGPVHVAAIYSIGLLQMDCHVRRYQQLYPDVELRFDYAHPAAVYSAVLSDDADLGLVSFAHDRGEICCIPWQEQEMVLVVAPSHHLAGCESVSTKELDGEDLIGFTPELRIRKETDRWLRNARVSVNVLHMFDNLENVKRAVEIGAGIAILPAPTVFRETALGSLEAIPLADAAWRRPLGIIHRRHRLLSNAVNKFIELLLESPATSLSASTSETDTRERIAVAVTDLTDRG